SVFYKDDAGTIFHTYSCYSRGLDPVNSAYQLLDLVPKGRDEPDLPHPMSWVRHHDKNEAGRPPAQAMAQGSLTDPAPHGKGRRVRGGVMYPVRMKTLSITQHRSDP